MPNELGINPWLRMWTKPKETIRAICGYDPRHRFLTLCILYGLPMVFQLAQNMAFGYSYSLVGIVLGAIFLSLFAGMVGITIATAVLYVTGKWVGGKATFIQVRSAIAWSNVTSIVTIALWGALIAYFRHMLFTDTFATAPFTQGESMMVMGIFLAQSAMSIWSLVLLVQSLAEVQGFSSARSVLNLLLSGGIIIACFWLVGLLMAQG
jgi:hypothetical protein